MYMDSFVSGSGQEPQFWSYEGETPLPPAPAAPAPEPPVAQVVRSVRKASTSQFAQEQGEREAAGRRVDHLLQNPPFIQEGAEWGRIPRAPYAPVIAVTAEQAQQSRQISVAKGVPRGLRAPRLQPLPEEHFDPVPLNPAPIGTAPLDRVVLPIQPEVVAYDMQQAAKAGASGERPTFRPTRLRAYTDEEEFQESVQKMLYTGRRNDDIIRRIAEDRRGGDWSVPTPEGGWPELPEIDPSVYGLPDGQLPQTDEHKPVTVDPTTDPLVLPGFTALAPAPKAKEPNLAPVTLSAEAVIQLPSLPGKEDRPHMQEVGLELPGVQPELYQGLAQKLEENLATLRDMGVAAPKGIQSPAPTTMPVRKLQHMVEKTEQRIAKEVQQSIAAVKAQERILTSAQKLIGTLQAMGVGIPQNVQDVLGPEGQTTSVHDLHDAEQYLKAELAAQKKRLLLEGAVGLRTKATPYRIGHLVAGKLGLASSPDSPEVPPEARPSAARRLGRFARAAAALIDQPS